MEKDAPRESGIVPFEEYPNGLTGPCPCRHNILLLRTRRFSTFRRNEIEMLARSPLIRIFPTGKMGTVSFLKKSSDGNIGPYPNHCDFHAIKWALFRSERNMIEMPVQISVVAMPCQELGAFPFFLGEP